MLWLYMHHVAVQVDAVPAASDNSRVCTLQVGDGRLPDVVRGRIAGNDRPNADFIAATSRHRAAVVVPSLPFAGSK
jgi:hypothetical protein